VAAIADKGLLKNFRAGGGELAGEGESKKTSV
jgi:hypothetical protein